jgi:hypothetical protein
MISDANSLLKKNGLILLLLPNLKSAAYEILGINTPTINPREHLNFIPRESVNKLLIEYGFEPIIWGQELPVIDLMWNYIPVSDKLRQTIIEEDKAYYHIYLYKKIS